MIYFIYQRINPEDLTPLTTTHTHTCGEFPGTQVIRCIDQCDVLISDRLCGRHRGSGTSDPAGVCSQRAGCHVDAGCRFLCRLRQAGPDPGATGGPLDLLHPGSSSRSPVPPAHLCRRLAVDSLGPGPLFPRRFSIWTQTRSK